MQDMSEKPERCDTDPGCVFVNNRMMRRGYTTGSCATAASKAAAIMLLTGETADSVRITTPNGTELDLDIEDISSGPGWVSCAVRKDGGDDIDATDGILVRSTVSLSDSAGISIDGGAGVGRVTRRGLDQPVGNAAINHVPRSTIAEAVRGVCASASYDGGLSVVISVPDGMAVAERTFNPGLGIIGGISIIGTSGIVEPMSKAALVETIRVEMRMALADGRRYLLVAPGNYGVDFVKEHPELSSEEPIKCSNFIGETIDMACELGAEGMLLVGNLGKMVKLAGGIMDTHSRNADCRMEILASDAALAGADSDTVREIMSCISTDDALGVLDGASLIQGTMDVLMGRIHHHMEHRSGGRIASGAVVFSNTYGVLGRTADADIILQRIRERA